MQAQRYSYQETLDFLYGREAHENPRPQDPKIFSAPCDVFFYPKFIDTLESYKSGNVTPEAFSEAIRQLENHAAIPIGAHEFWLHPTLMTVLMNFFHETTKGLHDEPEYHWRRRIADAIVRTIDTRGGVATIRSLPSERFDEVCTFAFRYCVSFPGLWRILYELSYEPDALLSYEKTIISVTASFISKLLEDADPNATDKTLTNEQLEALQYVAPTVYNVATATAESFGYLTSTASNGFLEQLKRLYDFLIEASDRGFRVPPRSVEALNNLIDRAIIFDSVAAINFSTGTLTRNLLVLLNDFHPDVARSAALAFGRICSTNAAVNNVWEAIKHPASLEAMQQGFLKALRHSSVEFREGVASALLSMLDGPLRVQKHVFHDILFDEEVQRRNKDLQDYSLLVALYD
ncbi:hypothetical protein GMRT_10147 [Giardia muris]|uniref:Uncharacterized protein n=1 Tax=Giardia muris TaxID=5742 RepID=A0A4Z1SM71_GIAMU|nr:hypothetical protein GMRT_10147 [Giardia muris]|eukprot:TNJ26784.1 hypothetical protein GMRT_10147 [Giardia muris]